MSKGSSFERAFCDQLSEWWTGEKGRRVFWRSSNSGGMATLRNKKGKKTKQHCGDVCSIDPIGFPLTDFLTIELKRGYSRHTIADLLDKPSGAAKQLYEKWFEQAEKAAESAGTPYWILVVKRDHREPVVFIDNEFFFAMPAAADDVRVTRTVEEGILSLHLWWKGKEVSGKTLRDFFSLVTPQEVQWASERANNGDE